jgi:hypothetical protein
LAAGFGEPKSPLMESRMFTSVLVAMTFAD